MSRQVVVLPAQFIAFAGAGGTWDIDPAAESLLPILDEEIADTFRKRGVKSNWTFGQDIAFQASRTGGLIKDPSQLGAQGIRRIKAGDTPLPEPLGTDVRNIVSLTSARYALLPLEVHVDTRDATRNGSIRMLLIDSRTARVVWVDDIAAMPQRDPQVVAESMSPYGFRMLAREIAGRFADMVAGQ